MPEHPNVQRIRSAYDAFAAADLATALKDLAPDAVFHFNGSGPLSGDHTGVDEISKALVGTFELTAGTQKLDIASIFADDHHGVVVLQKRQVVLMGPHWTSMRSMCLRSIAKVESPTFGTYPTTPNLTIDSSTASRRPAKQPDSVRSVHKPNTP